MGMREEQAINPVPLSFWRGMVTINREGKMKSWNWQMWVGKLLLLAVTIVEAIAAGLGLGVPYWAIIGTGVTWLAQFVLGLIPGEAWQKIIGKVLLLAVSTVGLVLEQLGLAVPIWAVLAPMVTGLAQYFISLVPSENGT